MQPDAPPHVTNMKFQGLGVIKTLGIGRASVYGCWRLPTDVADKANYVIYQLPIDGLLDPSAGTTMLVMRTPKRPERYHVERAFRSADGGDSGRLG